MDRRYKKMPIVGAVMTSFPYFVEADDAVRKVEKIMDDHDIRHLPVQEKGRLIGIVSERDLHHRVKRSSSAQEKEKIRARDIMVDKPYTVAFDTLLNEVVGEMAQRHIGSAIVVRRGKLAGVLSAIDVCRILGEYLGSRFGDRGGDDAA